MNDKKLSEAMAKHTKFQTWVFFILMAVLIIIMLLAIGQTSYGFWNFMLVSMFGSTPQDGPSFVTVTIVPLGAAITVYLLWIRSKSSEKQADAALEQTRISDLQAKTMQSQLQHTQNIENHDRFDKAVELLAIAKPFSSWARGLSILQSMAVSTPDVFASEAISALTKTCQDYSVKNRALVKAKKTKTAKFNNINQFIFDTIEVLSNINQNSNQTKIIPINLKRISLLSKMYGADKGPYIMYNKSFTHISFNDCDLEGLIFMRCNLDEAEFDNTQVNGFSKSIIHISHYYSQVSSKEGENYIWVEDENEIDDRFITKLDYKSYYNQWQLNPEPRMRKLHHYKFHNNTNIEVDI